MLPFPGRAVPESRRIDMRLYFVRKFRPYDHDFPFDLSRRKWPSFSDINWAAGKSAILNPFEERKNYAKI
jgi:hypothetical protein